MTNLARLSCDFRSNNIFELMTNDPIDALLKTGGEMGGEAEDDEDDQNLMEEEVDKSLHIKGQMNFMPDWNVVRYCSIRNEFFYP